MPRPPRIFFEGAIHHIVARGNNRMTLFRSTLDRRIYRKIWIMAKARFALNIHRWCFMDNHIHLLIRQLAPDGVAEAMHFVQARYARYFCRQYQWKGHVWESRYKNRLILDYDYLRHVMAYIENNPVEAGIVESADQFPWSSAAFYKRGFRDPLTDRDTFEEESVPKPAGNGGDREALFVGRWVVGRMGQVEELAKRFGDQLLSRPRRTAFPA